MSAQEPLHCISRALRLLGTIQHQLSKLVWSWYFNQVHYFSAALKSKVGHGYNCGYRKANLHPYPPRPSPARAGYETHGSSTTHGFSNPPGLPAEIKQKISVF
ncbi:hypothetical protein DFH08DRAFT_807398 [Mycena albidolilacea]|uniref:Uncharacterized protein n=1 Tax=Mycena albidolilacea TaxID=1033008 RepID=A0AAD7A5R6_9AGAR|nr:hypothetical protein DFH08DRAFT_807398 [Mycena albidolilacea]